MPFAILLLLLPLAAAAPTESRNYILDIEDGTLKNVRPVGESNGELDLSGMSLRALEKNAFDSVPQLKSLNLARNSLKLLPDFIFSNLSSLERLSLAENEIADVNHLFVGLEKLRTLNVSHNPIVHLRRGHLFGLTRSVRILTEGNVFWSVSTGAFENAFLKDEEEPKIKSKTTPMPVPVPVPMLVPMPVPKEAPLNERKNAMKRAVEKENEMDSMASDSKVAMRRQDTDKTPRKLERDVRMRICLSDGIVTSLETFKKEDALPTGCVEVPTDDQENKVDLQGQGIRGFQEGWYQIQNLPVASVDLTNNEITEITKETLNYLPRDLVYVNFRNNRIRRIWSQVIENEHLKMLNFKDNLIEEIEENALQKTNLTSLFLVGNQLQSLNFVSSLPATLTEFVVSGNQLTSIPNGVFKRLSRLIYLNFANNKITRFQEKVFHGMSSLEVMIATRNKLTDIEPRAFEGLEKLETLYLYSNSLSGFRRDTFAELKNLKEVNLAWNKFSKISCDTFAGLPKSLEELHVDFNEIETIEENSFVQAPKFILSLSGNKISGIPRGAFDLPTLRDLHLDNNTMTTVDGDSFEGLPQLKRLWLSRNVIAEIRKGACKNLGSLNILDISQNPFDRLENGALYGLSSDRGNFLYIYDNNLKEIQGGFLDDA